MDEIEPPRPLAASVEPAESSTSPTAPEIESPVLTEIEPEEAPFPVVDPVATEIEPESPVRPAAVVAAERTETDPLPEDKLEPP
jgi:hypothetical protein